MKQPVVINIQNLIGTLIIVDSNASADVEKQITEALAKAMKAIPLADI
ncbi:hypothetical protein [Dysgonomonas sp. 521]|nr:hypothetical protein [Dysgonomonas sp. 521]